MKRREVDEAAARWVRSMLEAPPRAVGEAAESRSGERALARDAGENTAGELGQEGWPEVWPEVWDNLELPPAPAVPAGFARLVADAWVAERERATAPILGANWMRAAAAAALLAGVALGGALSWAGEASGAAAADSESWLTTSLSEEYLAALAVPETALAPATDASDHPDDAEGKTAAP